MAEEHHEIRLTRSAERQLSSLPRPAGAKLLTTGGSERIWRLRVGDYRILYEILDDELVIRVIAFGHRREVCRGTR